MYDCLSFLCFKLAIHQSSVLECYNSTDEELIFNDWVK